MDADDVTLLSRWRDGDAASGQALFRRHFDSVYAFFETKFADDADELVQATFLACLKARDQFRGDSSFRTYLFAIARNELYRAIGTRQKTRARIDFEVSSIMDLVTTPGTKLARDQEHKHVIEAMQRLPVEQQILLELHYWQEMQIDQLAVVFETNAATLRQRLHRARKALKEALEKTAPKQALETLESMDLWVKGFVPGT